MNKEYSFGQKKGFRDRGREALYFLKSSGAKLRDIFPRKELSPFEQHEALFKKIHRLALRSANYDRLDKAMKFMGWEFDSNTGEKVKYLSNEFLIDSPNHLVYRQDCLVDGFTVTEGSGVMAFKPQFDKQRDRWNGTFRIRIERSNEQIIVFPLDTTGELVLIYEKFDKSDTDRKRPLENLTLYQRPRLSSTGFPQRLEVISPSPSQQKFINEALSAGMKAARK